MTTPQTAAKVVALRRLGLVTYDAALELQRRLAAARSAGAAPDTLLILQHPPTITLGVRADPAHVLVPPDELARRGVALVRTDRGGDATYHGPGQIVGYPILKLSQHGADLGRYVRAVEETIIRTLGAYDVRGERVRGLTGVWVQGGRAKICAIGVRLSAAGVTSHGFALNVRTDLAGFAQIVPCGISDRAVTSLHALLGPDAPGEAAVTERLVAAFGEVFEVELRPVPAMP
jgi:lipoyl(octanoyl) transferase